MLRLAQLISLVAAAAALKLPNLGPETRFLSSSRRSFFAASSAVGMFPRYAAAGALDEGAMRSMERQVEVRRRPAPCIVPRPKMELPFAVLLMRSSYSVVDDMDFIAMDDFQKQFFLFRQSEYQSYLDQLAGIPMLQGDLQDPKYLDFISFAQHDVISAAMKHGQTSFKEALMVDRGPDKEPEWTSQIVKRPAGLSTGNLPSEFDQRVGDRLLEWLVGTYNAPGPGGTPATVAVAELNTRVAPPGEPTSCCELQFTTKPTASFIESNLRQLLSWLKVNAYMTDFNVSVTPIGSNRANIELMVVAPATRWSQEVLVQQKSLVSNAYEVKACAAYLRAIGLEVSTRPAKFSGNEVSHIISVVGVS